MQLQYPRQYPKPYPSKHLKTSTYALSATAGTRKDNDLQYTKQFGNVTARAEYSLGEVAGITYDLSKRTVLYSEVEVTKLDGGYASGGTTRLNQTRQTGISAGINHMF